jgi:integrase
MRDLLQRYLDEHSKVNKKPTTYEGNKGYVERCLMPELGNYKVQEVSRADMYALQQKLSKRSKAMANHCHAILSKAFNLAEVWGWRADYTNPCRHVKKFPSKPRQRFLSKAEFNTLSKQLDFYAKAQLESPYVIAALKLLLFTGCRSGEILTLKWDYVDFDNHCFRLPDSKTGAKTVYFSNMVVDILKGLKRQPNNPYVVAGELEGKHLNNLQKPWQRIRKDCGLEDVRIHDLRHSFASMAAASGMSLPLIGAMLGHTQPQTTAQYVHLMGDPMREAANLVGGAISEAMYA